MEDPLPMQKSKSVPETKKAAPRFIMRSASEGNPDSKIKKFDGWLLDPFAELKPASKSMPLYTVLNDLPLPIGFDDRGKVKGIFNCFNCGSPNHRCSDCEIARDHACIRLNKNWMDVYGKGPTAKSYRPPRGRTRYFEKLNEESNNEEKEDEGEEPQVTLSGLKIFDSIEEMPEPVKHPLKRAISITQMEEDERNFQLQRRRRGRGGGRRNYGDWNNNRQNSFGNQQNSYGDRRNSYGNRNYGNNNWRQNNRGGRHSRGPPQNQRWGHDQYERNYNRRGRGGGWNSYNNNNQGYGSRNHRQSYQPYSRRGRGGGPKYF